MATKLDLNDFPQRGSRLRSGKGDNVNKLSFSKVVCLVFVFCAAAATASHAQAFNTLASFDGTNGGGPFYVTLVQGFDGDFYGTTEGGVTSGNVFKITAQGTLTTLQYFGGSNGALPYAGLVQGIDGNFYGTTHSGSYSPCKTGCGTIFKMTPGWDDDDAAQL